MDPNLRGRGRRVTCPSPSIDPNHEGADGLIIFSDSIRLGESNQLRLGRLDGFILLLLWVMLSFLVQTHSVGGGRLGCIPYFL